MVVNEWQIKDPSHPQEPFSFKALLS